MSVYLITRFACLGSLFDKTLGVDASSLIRGFSFSFPSYALISFSLS